MPAPELVIFDCDGVLVDSEPISNAVLAEMLAAEGWELTVAKARAEFQGLTLAGVRTRAERRLGRALPERFLDEFQARRAAVFRRELAPVEGAADAVGAVIAAGVGACVASQAGLAKTDLSLVLTGLGELFPAQTRFSAEMVVRGKPAPDLFLHAAAAMGAAPARCAVVEDTPSGVRAARAAGMRAIGLTLDSDEGALVAAGAEPLASLYGLSALLGLASASARSAP